MNKRRLTKVFVAAAMLAVAANSCITPKKVLYLQDMEDNSQIQLEDTFEAKISAYDELTIIVSAFEEELAKPFNLTSMHGGGGYGGGGYGGANQYTYLVDVNGDINFPVLGKLHVAGLTRLQLQEKIKNLLIEGNYIEEPFVNARFYNFKIFFLGADGGKAITIPNERCTFLEALALSGDLDAYTKRDKIGILRETDGKMTMHYIDPRSSKVFNDPYFLLQQNDFIITESIKSKYYRDEFSYWMSWMSLVTSISSIVTMILVLLPK